MGNAAKKKFKKESDNPYSSKYPKVGQIVTMNGLTFLVSNISLKTGYVGLRHVIERGKSEPARKD